MTDIADILERRYFVVKTKLFFVHSSVDSSLSVKTFSNIFFFFFIHICVFRSFRTDSELNHLWIFVVIGEERKKIVVQILKVILGGKT